MTRRTNRLSDETSPYLLEHAHDPVDWLPWTEEALGRARSEDRPILLSIGYSACHYCHVMQRESFADADIARKMNASFVCIKVDREERPDLDEIYLDATVALTGSGGWPMTVFLTPEQKPFFAGTYFPKTGSGGRPGFGELLDRIDELWRTDRPKLESQAKELTDFVRSRRSDGQSGAISGEWARRALRQLETEFDPSFGGFGRAPKFPHPSALSLLLRHHRLTGDERALSLVTRTLDGMMTGGIYDQLGGGFARYSVDGAWLVPHFEKMLTDSAQLAVVYLEAKTVTGDARYARVARETLDYALREMQSPAGGFFSSTDAESEGEEGRFFVWTKKEIERALGKDPARAFCAFYGVTEEGNFRGKNVLTARRSLAEVAKELGVRESALGDELEASRQKLLEVRSTRTAPAVDDKVVTATTGLMLTALARGARVLGEGRYLTAAERAAAFVLAQHVTPDGRLLRSSRSGAARGAAFLEDYAFLAEGLLELHEAGGPPDALDHAVAIAERMLREFGDAPGAAGDGSAALYHTAHDHEPLLSRPKRARDGALPGPNAVAARVLARLGAHLGRADLTERALAIASAFSGDLRKAPRAYPTLLGVVDFLLERPLEVVLAGDPHAEGMAELEGVLAAHYLPHLVCVRAIPGEESKSVFALGKRAIDGRPTAYVCRDSVCQKPTSHPDEFDELLTRMEEENRRGRRRELGRARLAGRAHSRAARGLSLGTQRVGIDNVAHRRAVERALESGIRLVDTSPSFALGDAERLVGEVLAELVGTDKLTREDVTLVTKVGVLVGADAAGLGARVEAGELAHAIPLRPGTPLEGGAYCLDPRSIDEQIDGSLERLGVLHLDVVLLQSPEHYLEAGMGRDAFTELLVGALSALEGEVARGRIGAYGVMTNTATISSAEGTAVSLDELLRAATRAGGDAHRFEVIALPISVAEQARLDVARAAKERGLRVHALRPLTALSGGALVRLRNLPPLDEAARSLTLSSARYKVAALEAEFETTLAARLRLAKKIGEGQMLPLSGILGKTLEKVESLEQFELAETTLVTPRIRSLLGHLDQLLAGHNRREWEAFRDRYVRAVGTWLAAVRNEAIEKNRRFLAQLDFPAGENPSGATGEGASLSTRALDWALGRPEIDVVTVGLRTVAQVDEAVALAQNRPPGAEC